MVAKNKKYQYCSTRCFARKQQLEDLNQHAASVKYKNKEAKKKFLQSLIGLKLNVPEHWWIDSRGNKLWKCVVESINLDDEYRRYFIIKCTDVAFPEDRHTMSYKDIRKYADMKQDGIVLFDIYDVLFDPYQINEM